MDRSRRFGAGRFVLGGIAAALGYRSDLRVAAKTRTFVRFLDIEVFCFIIFEREAWGI